LFKETRLYMKYGQFKNRVLSLPLIKSRDLIKSEKETQIMRNQFKRWQEKGLVIKLKRGIYILNENDRKINPSRQFIANQLYAPSYVSLEYALNFYGIIPERVMEVTSITTKKTARFSNGLGSFVYQRIKPSAFRGFKAVKDERGLTYLMAEPEKAIVDFLYLNLSTIKTLGKGVFKDSYRFQNIGSLHQNKLKEFSKLFKSNRLTENIKILCEFIKKEKVG
ncbi:MAG: hypothetical protein NTV07_01450, partial [Candidatus Omnitrophica bacterium]|nr:hypothetical protein [Candidatus Omnitrophota bacterium]